MPDLRLSAAQRWLIALMAVREPLRWQQPESGTEAAFFPGGGEHWPWINVPLRTVRSLHGKGAIEPTQDSRMTAFWDMEPTQAAMDAAGAREIASAQRWNDQRNLQHRKP